MAQTVRLFLAVLLLTALPAWAQVPPPPPPPPTVPCPPSSICGAVTDAKGNPLTGTYIRLMALDLSRRWQFSNQTDCAAGQGCPDPNGGLWLFNRDYWGQPLAVGSYLTELKNYGYLIERRTVYYDGTSASVGTVVPHAEPVAIKIEAVPNPIVPPTGGDVDYWFSLENQLATPLTVDIRVEVNSAGETDFWTSFQKGWPQRVRLAPNEFKMLQGKLRVPGLVPGGFDIYVTISAERAGDPYGVLTSAYFNVLKDVRELVP